VRERIREYELMMIVSTLNAGEPEIQGAVDRVQRAISDGGGSVTNVDSGPPWGRRKLAYPIREFVEGEPYRRVFNEGFYVLVHFNLGASHVTEIERSLKLNDAVLRHLLTQVDPRSKSAAIPPAFDEAPADAEADEVELDEAELEGDGEDEA
jgi:small subunit ribosomal protein S6